MQTAIPHPEKTHRRQVMVGCLLVLAASFGFSAKAVLVKLAYGYSNQLDAITLMLLRMTFSLPFFLVASLWYAWQSKHSQTSARMQKLDWLTITLLGCLGYYISSLLDFEGLAYISAGLERLILFLYPTFVVLLSACYHRKAVNRSQAFALLLSYGGILLVYTEHSIQSNANGLLLGVAFVAGSALTFAVFLVGSGVLIKRIGSMRFTAYSMTVACIVTALHFLLRHGVSPLNFPVKIYVFAGVMAVFSTVVPSFLMNAGIQRIGAGPAAIVSSAGPVGTLILAFYFLGEALTVIQLAGTFIVMVGVYVVGKAKA